MKIINIKIANLLKNLLKFLIPKRWSFDLVNVTTYSSNTDAFDLDIQVRRIGRGRFGFIGFIDIKIDLDDDVVIEGGLKRSKTKDGPYADMPYQIENVTLTMGMNIYYKSLVMPTVKKCVENAPVFDIFKAPLTKRFINIDNCEFDVGSWPDIAMEGYYLVQTTLHSTKFTAYWDTIAYVENNYW